MTGRTNNTGLSSKNAASDALTNLQNMLAASWKRQTRNTILEHELLAVKGGHYGKGGEGDEND